jgi:hypothetical protein
MDRRLISRAAIALLGVAALGACSINTEPPARPVAAPVVVTPPAAAVVPAPEPPSTVVVQPRAY